MIVVSCKNFTKLCSIQVRRLIVFRRQMFGRIFAISDRVRAYFAPVRVLSRVAPRRAKNASGDLSSTVFMNTQSFLHHACRRPVPAACEAAQHRAIGTRIHIPFYLISIFRPTIRRDGVRIELVAGNAHQSCRSAVDLGRPTCREQIHHACDTTRPATRGRTSVGLPEDRLPGEAL